MAESTDMGCACVCGLFDSAADVCEAKMVKARKEHTCCECGEKIQPGEKYECTRGLWEGSWDYFKTCYPCVCIRNELCCHGWEFGELRGVVLEAYGIDYVSGDTARWVRDEE